MDDDGLVYIVRPPGVWLLYTLQTIEILLLIYLIIGLFHRRYFNRHCKIKLGHYTTNARDTALVMGPHLGLLAEHSRCCSTRAAADDTNPRST